MEKFSNLKSAITLRKVNFSDKNFVLKLYNFNSIKDKFFNNKVINSKDHILWLKNKIDLKEPFYIIQAKKTRIGYIRYRKLNSKKFEISLAVREKYQGLGLAKKAFFLSIKKLKYNKVNIIAKVKKKNIESSDFFTRCGFVEKKKLKFKIYEKKIF